MIEKALFGRTGHSSTRTLFGGFAVGYCSQAEADETLELLLQFGVNHIDTAVTYGDAELRIGPWMENHRDKFFLATKTEERTHDGAWRELNQSLERLRTDHIDLWQMHFLVDENGWQTAMGPGGALEAFVKARDQGMVSYLGVTGHNVDVAKYHLRSLERFDFDSVLLPYSLSMMQNPHYAADFEQLFAVCAERKVAVQTIKSLARGSWGAKKQTHGTWYEPFTTQAEIDLAVQWVLSRPGVFLNTVGDRTLLPLVLDAASRMETAVAQQTITQQMQSIPMEPLFT